MINASQKMVSSMRWGGATSLLAKEYKSTEDAARRLQDEDFGTEFSWVRWSATIEKTKSARYTVTTSYHKQILANFAAATAPATTALTIGDDVAAAVAARRHQSLTLAAWMCSRGGAASRPAVRPVDVDPADVQVRPHAVDPAAWKC